MTERKAIQVENALIILGIVALWPAILGFDPRISRPVLAIALTVMIVINVRRWRRLLALRDLRRKQLSGDCRPEKNAEEKAEK